MEIVIVVFLGIWVTACSLIAFHKIRKDLDENRKSEDRKQ